RPKAKPQTNLYDVTYDVPKPDAPSRAAPRSSGAGQSACHAGGVGSSDARAEGERPRAKGPDSADNPWRRIGIALGAVLALLTLVYGSPKQIGSMFTILFFAAFYGFKSGLGAREDRVPSTNTATAQGGPRPTPSSPQAE